MLQCNIQSRGRYAYKRRIWRLYVFFLYRSLTIDLHRERAVHLAAVEVSNDIMWF